MAVFGDRTTVRRRKEMKTAPRTLTPATLETTSRRPRPPWMMSTARRNAELLWHCSHPARACGGAALTCRQRPAQAIPGGMNSKICTCTQHCVCTHRGVSSLVNNYCVNIVTIFEANGSTKGSQLIFKENCPEQASNPQSPA